ncbi:MAG TPA: NUDIX domain-containing protein [Microlunatus sp.]
MARSSAVPTFRHEAVAVVFKITDSRLTVLAWQRARDPYQGAWALPSGAVQADETLGACAARNLATKVDLSQIAHLEQLETRSDPGRDPFQRTIATAYLGLVPSTADPHLPENAGWIRTHRLPKMAFDHASVVRSAIDRLQRKLSYSNIGFGLAPEEFTLAQLREIYRAALGYDVAPTNLKRVLERRGQLEPTGRTAASNVGGGRPAALYRFSHRELAITDPFAALRPGS